MPDITARATAVTRLFLSAGLLALPALGCGILDQGHGVPEEARVLITGSSVNALEVVVANDFTYVSDNVGNPVVVLIESDTIFIDPAAVHDERYDIAPARGFFVRLANPDTTTAIITMKVWVDGDLKYNQTDYTLVDSSIEWSRRYNDFGY